MTSEERKPQTTKVGAPRDKQSLRVLVVPFIPRSPLWLLFDPDSLKVGTSQEIAPMIKAFTRRLGVPSGAPSGSWSHGLGSLPLGKVSSSKGLTRVSYRRIGVSGSLEPIRIYYRIATAFRSDAEKVASSVDGSATHLGWRVHLNAPLAEQ